tara:strand:- start:92 stop:202 length:111 start_codon:yes stop_codon:yes gene_type:complete
MKKENISKKIYIGTIIIKEFFHGEKLHPKKINIIIL